MMGDRQVVQGSLFYEFSIETHVPADHLLRSIDRFVDLAELRSYLAPFYSTTGHPSVDPELMIRMLIVGYCFGIRSERRLCDEVHLNLAYRWFCRLGLEGRVPDHSTFSKNRHGPRGRSGLKIRTDIEVDALRRHARHEADGRVAARLLAIADALSGMSRQAAAEAAGMDRQTLRDWVHRFNADGIAGLADRPRSGPRTRLNGFRFRTKTIRAARSASAILAGAPRFGFRILRLMADPSLPTWQRRPQIVGHLFFVGRKNYKIQIVE